MLDEKVLQVAILIWGCVFCAIAAICIFLSSNYDREKRRYLILMESFASHVIADGCHGAYFQRISRSSGQCDGPYFEFSRIPFK